jgi:GNAT superfamily N-acetyltransferase
MGLAAGRADCEGASVNARVIDTTVTYLAMGARPTQLPPMPNTPRLALMKAEKIPLHYYRYLYGAVGGSWLWVERLALGDEELSKKIHAVGIEVFVLYANGSPAGYYELDRRDPGSVRLVYFGLMPEWTGMKIGPWFLGAAVTQAFSRGATELRVNTCTLDHPAALPLYQRLGFAPVRRENRQIKVPANFPVPGHIAARMEL